MAGAWAILLGARRRDTADMSRSALKSAPTVSEQLGALLRTFADTAQRHIRLEGGGYRRDHLRALAQRVEVSDGEVRIMGSKSRLLQVLTGKMA